MLQRKRKADHLKMEMVIFFSLALCFKTEMDGLRKWGSFCLINCINFMQHLYFLMWFSFVLVCSFFYWVLSRCDLYIVSFSKTSSSHCCDSFLSPF
jgi:hypothetical protein